MLNIAGVVILYNPDLELLNRVETYLEHICKLFVFDNSADTAEFLEPLIKNKKVLYLHDGSNKGISVRLNQAANLALGEKYEWLLTMDQDSYFPQNSLVRYRECIESYSLKNTTAMFGVQFQNEFETNKNCNPREVLHLITSGSILNLNLFQINGAFDEALFIDKVDHDYCLRALQKDFKVIQFENLFLHHTLGRIVKGRSLKNFKVSTRVLHSPLRMYYIVRNYFYLKRKFKGEFEESFAEMKSELIYRLKNNFIYGKNKFLLIRYVVRGYFDYKASKMGKYSKNFVSKTFI